jgi:2-keto-4-pentenoate hydratase/2-oxohepta-3-ene-1,7-dioic acid hydratase in catechol pathway
VQQLGPWLNSTASVQNLPTSDMIFTIKRLVFDISQYRRFTTRDVDHHRHAVGRRSGYMKPPSHLKPGDVDAFAHRRSYA